MPIPTEVPLAVVVVMAVANLILCTYLEKRLRRNIRLGIIEERRYSPRQLEEFRRIREEMKAKERKE
ncbi:hypothetical protein FE783_13625 [Paenibacillus mesophilus]|uniref:hypothetical protein n=1 Tax=Paenibacillus mesophilus TaxID=2582849 RepID=UPI00110D2B14|nr:hypothetical protein [Paenibacillus mesophilus]TMV49538.1 hypothetical protein FE783_13625 [Paenibacillus mesophilus]